MIMIFTGDSTRRFMLLHSAMKQSQRSSWPAFSGEPWKLREAIADARFSSERRTTTGNSAEDQAEKTRPKNWQTVDAYRILNS